MFRQSLVSVALLASQVARLGAQGLPRARPEDVRLRTAELRTIDAQLQRWVDSGKFAGIVAVVARHGKLAYVVTAGSLDSSGRAIALDDVFRMYSMTKPIASAEPPGKNGFGYGGAVRVDSGSAEMPGSVGTFRWSGFASTFFWIDPKADLIAMLWSQYIPEPEIWAVDGQYQRLVYAAARQRNAPAAGVSSRLTKR